MAKRMLIDAQHTEETRVVIADERQIYDFDFVSTSKKQLKGNIYLAKITRVEPSLQAAFVEYGGGKQGFLPFSEIHADYYQIPVSDRQRLMEEANAIDSDDDDQQPGQQENTTVSQDPAFPEAPEDLAPNTASQDSFPISAEDAATETLPSENDRPAYLMQAAVDISTSVELPEPLQEPSEAENGEAEAKAEEPANNEDGTPNSEAGEDVETIPNEEEEYNARRKRNQFFKRYKIQEVIRRGQIVLVQVIKEERGNKGVSLTTYLSLAGRYCVLMPNSPKDGGISRKIASAEDRRRLKAISTEMRLADGMSVIIRTAGMDRSRDDIKRDYDYLVNLWNQIREDTLKSNAPALIYEESDIIKRAIRDHYSNDIDEVIIEGESAYKTAKEFVRLLLPDNNEHIVQYKEATPLFYAYNIEEQLLSMHDPVVKLRSGGYLVINPTEALISIDVNSGRATGERNIEETAIKTNLEAAAEVARQLRLRDLAGLIVIDFIDMLESRNRRAVEKALKDALKADRAKIQIGRISPFGLMEMSRQRLRPSISETNMVQCPHCEGRGFIRSNESMSIQMIRAIEKEASHGTWSGLRLIAPQAVALHLLNHKRDILRTIEERYNISVQVLINPDLTASEFNLEKMRRSQSEQRNDSERGERNDRNDRNRSRRPRNDRPRNQDIATAPAPVDADNDNVEASNITEVSDDNNEDGRGNRRGNRRGRRGGRGRNRNRNHNAQDNGEVTGNMNEEQPVTGNDGNTAEDGEQQEQRRPRRSRGGRGRRNWRENDGENQERNSGNARPSHSGDNVIQAFAPEPAAPSIPPAPQRNVAQTAISQEPASHASNQPAKKGWWQKIIELDD